MKVHIIVVKDNACVWNIIPNTIIDFGGDLS